MSDLSQSFDLSHLFSQMLSTVPLWAFVYVAYHSWVMRAKEDRKALDARIEDLFAQRKESKGEMMAQVDLIHDKLNRIELRLATQGVDELRATMDSIKSRLSFVENHTLHLKFKTEGTEI